ncbi:MULTISPECIES: hypothetical protein, partial [Cryobacterium]|uniref:hypothetical protein n=3 Tax=Microbacteriaceae TaxID=85023 RepID=UPI0018E0B5F8
GERPGEPSGEPQRAPPGAPGPGAAAALDRLLLATERDRFSRAGTAPRTEPRPELRTGTGAGDDQAAERAATQASALVGDLDLVGRAVHEGSARGIRLRSRLLPASLWRPAAGRQREHPAANA